MFQSIGTTCSLVRCCLVAVRQLDQHRSSLRCCGCLNHHDFSSSGWRFVCTDVIEFGDYDRVWPPDDVVISNRNASCPLKQLSGPVRCQGSYCKPSMNPFIWHSLTTPRWWRQFEEARYRLHVIQIHVHIPLTPRHDAWIICPWDLSHRQSSLVCSLSITEVEWRADWVSFQNHGPGIQNSSRWYNKYRYSYIIPDRSLWSLQIGSKIIE